MKSRKMLLLIRDANATPKRVHRRADVHRSRPHAALARRRRSFDAFAKCAHQSEQLAARLRTSSVVHRDSNQLGAGRAKILQVLRVVRQLAEAKRSPVPAVE